MESRFISPITWPGGKSKQWKLIKDQFPNNTNNMNYYEPFFGGGSVGLNALKNQLFKNYNFLDLNKELISFWNTIRNFHWNKKCWCGVKGRHEYCDNWNHPIEEFDWLSEELFYPNVKTLAELKQKIIELNIYDYDYLDKKFLLNNNLTFNGQQQGTWTELRLQKKLKLSKT